jgi:hypothetical protein
MSVEPREYTCEKCRSTTLSYRPEIGCPKCDMTYKYASDEPNEGHYPIKYTKWEEIKLWFGKFLP